MFQKIQEVVDDPKVLVCVLIDEVRTSHHRSLLNMFTPSVVSFTALLIPWASPAGSK